MGSADRRHDVEFRRLERLVRVLEFDVETGLLREQEARVGDAPLILALGQNHDGVAPEGRQPAKPGPVQDFPERLHCPDRRFRGAVDPQQAEFALHGGPVVRRMFEPGLIVRAPPQEPAAVMREAVPEHVPR